MPVKTSEYVDIDGNQSQNRLMLNQLCKASNISITKNMDGDEQSLYIYIKTDESVY